jgi:hypothetical protein
VGVCATIWAIWNTRNYFIFKKTKKTLIFAGYPYGYHNLKNQTGDRIGEAFGSWFTGWTASSNRFDVGFLVVKITFF